MSLTTEKEGLATLRCPVEVEAQEGSFAEPDDLRDMEIFNVANN